MSESLSFPEETSPQPEAPVFTDILSMPEWDELRKEAIRAEDAMMLFKDEDQASQHVIDRLIELVGDLHGVLDTRHFKQPCRVLCSAYSHEDLSRSEASGAPNARPDILDSESVTFYGVNLLYFNQRWQAVIELYQAERTDGEENEFYYVPLREKSFINLRIQEPSGDIDDIDQETEDAIKLLGNHVIATRKFVASPKFSKLPQQDQREVLQQFTNDLDEDMPREFREQGVVVRCARYYTKYDDMPDFPISYSYTDLKKVPVDERQSLIGEIVGFEYPELQDIPTDQQLMPRDFTINKGASCMVLRSGTDGGMTHYILPQSISDIF